MGDLAFRVTSIPGGGGKCPAVVRPRRVLVKEDDSITGYFRRKCRKLSGGTSAKAAAQHVKCFIPKSLIGQQLFYTLQKPP